MRLKLCLLLVGNIKVLKMKPIYPTRRDALRAFALAPLAAAMTLFMIAVGVNLLELLLSDTNPGFKSFMTIGMFFSLVLFITIAYMAAGALTGAVFDSGSASRTTEVGLFCGFVAASVFIRQVSTSNKHSQRDAPKGASLL